MRTARLSIFPTAALNISTRIKQLLPQDCLLCGGHAGAGLVCAACDADLPAAGAADTCPRCALPGTAGAVCGGCLAHPPAFDRACAALVYRYPAAELVQAFKYGGQLAVGSFLAHRLAERVRGEVRPDWLLPMPLAPARLAERGFNQAALLARHLALTTGAPLALGLLTRVRDTPPQASLPWRERQANIRGAFAAAGGIAGVRVVIVDDIMTTGATLEEAARTLKRAGAAEVAVWVVARTPRDAAID